VPKEDREIVFCRGFWEAPSFRYCAPTAKAPKPVPFFAAAHEIHQRSATVDTAIGPFAILKFMASPENVKQRLALLRCLCSATFLFTPVNHKRRRPWDTSLLRRLDRGCGAVQDQFTAEAESTLYRQSALSMELPPPMA
jgi:hypothetical protein